MNIHQPSPHEPRGAATPESTYLSRRRLLKTVGLGVGALALAGGAWGGYRYWVHYRGTPDEVLGGGGRQVSPEQLAMYPAKRDERFEYGRPETAEVSAARYTNFYEFSGVKDNWTRVAPFQPDPWKITIDGLCRQPQQLDVGDLLRQHQASLVERQYRHRCVETWAMTIPWTGIPLAEIVRAADPLPEAKFVRFVSFDRPDEAPGMVSRNHPWPYVEGLRLAEATNELALLATGMYGHPLLKQHGAPIRLVVPWKYGFKSIKSIERIEFVREQPSTFWNTVSPQEYPFLSNVNPEVPHPRWSQKTEWMLGTFEQFATQPYNGYGDYVAELYPKRAPG